MYLKGVERKSVDRNRQREAEDGAERQYGVEDQGQDAKEKRRLPRRARRRSEDDWDAARERLAEGDQHGGNPVKRVKWSWAI